MKASKKILPREEWPYEVPGNWVWTIWGICGKFISGSGFPKEYQGKTECTIPFYKVGSLKYTDCNGYLCDISDTIDESTRTTLKAALIPKDSIIFAKIGEAIRLNRRSLNRIPCCIDNNMMAYIPHLMCNLRYAYFWSTNIDLYDYTNATTVPAIRKSDLETIPFPLPPLPEQQRIVARIESLFAKLDAAAEKIRAALARFPIRKAAILHKAFTGELTKKWREENGVGMESWEYCILLDILKSKPRNGYSPKPVEYPTKYKSMTLSATTTGVFRPEHYKYIDENIPDDSYLWLKPGDILIQRANSIEKVGTSAIYNGNAHEFIYPDLIMKLETQSQHCAKYVEYYLKQENIMAYFRSHATGTAGNMPKINQATVSNVPMYIPTLPEQKEIVRILDNIFAREQAAKEAAERLLERVALTKKSILARAFRGKLGTNDPTEESAERWLSQENTVSLQAY